jgi:hypothetical protein
MEHLYFEAVGVYPERVREFKRIAVRCVPAFAARRVAIVHNWAVQVQLVAVLPKVRGGGGYGVEGCFGRPTWIRAWPSWNEKNSCCCTHKDLVSAYPPFG